MHLTSDCDPHVVRDLSEQTEQWLELRLGLRNTAISLNRRKCADGDASEVIE